MQQDRRVLDVAQQVREDARAAVTALLAERGGPATGAVLVVVIRTGATNMKARRLSLSFLHQCGTHRRRNLGQGADGPDPVIAHNSGCLGVRSSGTAFE
jgi:hypothetical protein